jgi:hypothetical protein
MGHVPPYSEQLWPVSADKEDCSPLQGHSPDTLYTAGAFASEKGAARPMVAAVLVRAVEVRLGTVLGTEVFWMLLMIRFMGF